MIKNITSKNILGNLKKKEIKNIKPINKNLLQNKKINFVENNKNKNSNNRENKILENKYISTKSGKKIMIFRTPKFTPSPPINYLEHQKGPNTPKIAILLRGAVSRVNGNFKTGMNPNKCNYVNYKACYLSIMKHIIKANINCSFDFFIHSWTKDLENELKILYKPVNSKFEDNLLYKKEFEDIIKLYPQSNGGLYNQLSQGLTIKKGIELIEEHCNTTNTKYDLVIIYRPDVLLWKNMNLKNYFGDYIYINRNVDIKNGDLHFIMNYERTLKFKNLYDSAKNNNKPQAHKWIEEYINNYINEKPFYDNIQVEKDQDVVRKIYGSCFIHGFITAKQLKDYGLTEEEIKKYVNRI